MNLAPEHKQNWISGFYMLVKTSGKWFPDNKPNY